MCTPSQVKSLSITTYRSSAVPPSPYLPPSANHHTAVCAHELSFLFLSFLFNPCMPPTQPPNTSPDSCQPALYFACQFIVLIRFHILVKSHGTCFLLNHEDILGIKMCLPSETLIPLPVLPYNSHRTIGLNYSSIWHIDNFVTEKYYGMIKKEWSSTYILNLVVSKQNHRMCLGFNRLV